MAEFWAAVAALLLVAASVLLHYEVLSRTTAEMPRFKLGARLRNFR